MVTLRPDQAQLKAEIYNAYAAGHTNVLGVLPTGGGKSVIVSDIALDLHNQNARQAIMAHRNELVGQMSLHIARRGIKHRIIGSKSTISGVINDHRAEFGRSFVNPDAPISVASVQTIVARKEQLVGWGSQITNWTLDEAHHALKNNLWGRAIELFPNARGLGVTATPSRADGMGLGRHHDGLFDYMAVGPTMRELINLGALSDYEIVVPETDFTIDDDAVTAKGDYSPKKMQQASKQSHIVGDVATEYVKWAYGKRAICFATDVETAGEIANKLTEIGVPAAAVSAKTPDATRRDMIKRFRDGRVWVLVNVDLFDEGFDVPACECVIMARPTASLGKYLQMVGRGLRVMEGKPHGLIIDMVSNWKRHNFPDKVRPWTLDRREKRAKPDPDPEDVPLRVCHECSRPYERVLIACPYCGTEVPLPDPTSRKPEQVDGDLMLLDRETIARMLAETELESPADIGERVKFAAGEIAAKGAQNRQKERFAAQARLRAAIEQWAGCQRALGREDRQSHKRFYLTTGMDVLTALAQPREDMDKMSEKVEGWNDAFIERRPQSIAG